jgi:pilus assembly protein CpaE
VPLNINLVSADPQLAQLLRETGSRCIALPSEALSALTHRGTQQPDLLVLDLRGQQQFPPALALLKREHPTTGVLLVVSQLDPAMMLEAMRAGVNECITDPISVAELHAAIKRLSGHLAAPVRGEVFAFIGAKGGVGATTVAVNVASALAKANPGSTLLIDLNVACGDAAVFLGAEPRFSVLDALENIARLDDAYFRGLVVRTKAGLDLLGASSRPVTAAIDAGRLRALLDFASQTYRYVVLDVPRSDMTMLDTLEVATEIVLIANQELATVRSASRMAASLRSRYGRDRLGLVLTRTDRRAEIGHEDVERTVGIEIRHTFPSDYRLALEAMNKGRPIVLETQNDLSKSLKAFARTLSGDGESRDRAPKGKPGSLFGLLAPKRA